MRQTLSLRIYQDLYSKIRSHFYKPGEQLPTEVVLSEMYNASLSPVRQALGKLESGQLIVRMPGKGTFVAESMPWENMLAMSGFGVHFIDKKIDSDDVRCPTEECRRKVMPEEVRRLFRTEEGKEWTFLSRVRYVNGQPLFYMNHYFERPGPEEVFRAGEIKSLRRFLAPYGVRPAYVSERVRAVAADGALGRILSVPEGYPLLKIVRRELDGEYRPVICGEYYVNSEKWDYRVQYNAGEL